MRGERSINKGNKNNPNLLREKGRPLTFSGILEGREAQEMQSTAPSQLGRAQEGEHGSALASAPDKSLLQQTSSAWGSHGKDLSTPSQAPNLDRKQVSLCAGGEAEPETSGDRRGRDALYLKINPSSTSLSKSRLENKPQLSGNCITMMKTTEGLSIMTKKQVLMGSEPSRIPLNISNAKMRDFSCFLKAETFPPCPAPLRQLSQ